MRTADAVWPVVWGICFAAGVILGTDPAAALSEGRSYLRGGAGGAESMVPSPKDEEAISFTKNSAVVPPAQDERVLELPEDVPAAAAGNLRRSLLGISEDAAYGAARGRSQSELFDVEWPTAVQLQHIRDVNGGLWGPNDEEVKELIAREKQARNEKDVAQTNGREVEDSYRATAFGEASATSTVDMAEGDDEWDMEDNWVDSFSFEF